jgi:hypothetical protein
MRTPAKFVLALLSISLGAARAADKDFKPAPPDQYPHQENQKVLIGSKPFDTFDQTKPIFGKKTDLNRYGVLPILVVIQNNRGQALDLNGLDVKLAASGAQSVIPLDPPEVAAIANPAHRPNNMPSPIPHKRQSNSLDAVSIVERAFTARMLPAGDQASGFFYFQARPEPGMRLMIRGIFERPSGKEILYFEIPL